MEILRQILTRKYSKRVITIFISLSTLIAFSGVYAYLYRGREAAAAIQASKVLIIANDDTYYAAGINGGSSADNMKAALVANGFDTNAITVWKESANGSAPPPLATLNQYDVVIFSQGVGYRNTNNGKQGLNTNDLTLLKQYLNITSTGNKARLLIEGEDVMSDISRVGTSTDQRDVLKIATASSSDNYGKITRLNITDTTHSIFKYPYDISSFVQANTNYQTSYQDYVAPNQTVGARTIASANYSGRTGAYAVMNTYGDAAGHREVFIPFPWRVDGTVNNTISDYTVNGKQWRDQLLVNMVSWVGERKITVSSSDIANYTASRNETSEMLALTLTPSMVDTTVTPLALSDIKVSLGGTIDQTKVTAKLFEDKGTIGVLDGADTLLDSASFTGGVATIPVNMEVTATKNLIMAYQFAADTPDDATAVANMDGTSFVVHGMDKLTRVYAPSVIQSSPTTVKIGGTAVIKTPSNGSTVGGDVTFTGITSTDYTLYYTSGYNNQAGPWTQFATGTGAVNNGTLGTWTSTGVPDGGYTVKLVVATGTQTFVNLYVDNTAPQITNGPQHENLRDTSVTINWNTNESSTSQVVYRVSPAGAWNTVTDTSKVQQHSIGLTKLTPNTDYEYQVVSADEVGNQVTSAVRTFTTYDLGPVAEITSPAIIAQLAPRISDAVPIEGSAYTSQAGHSVTWTVYYGKGAAEDEVTSWETVDTGSNQVNNGLITTWNAPLTDGAYVLWLAVTDPALNGVTAQTDFYLPVVVDNTKPQIFNAKAINITNTTAIISWDTSKATVDEVSYGPAPGILPITYIDSDKDKRVFLFGLQPNTTYFYHIAATDLGNHRTQSPELSFTTANLTGENNLPVVSAVYLTAAGRTESTVDLRWNAAYDESGIAGYKIFRSLDNVSWEAIGGVPGEKLTYNDTELNQDHIYYYCLTAVDIYGNESVQTTPIKVLTMAIGRTNPHGAYSKLTVMCSKCHTVHRGKKEFLFNRTQEATMCYTCHDAAGTGSKYAIEAEYDPVHISRHPLPMNHTNKECASCHNPHLNPTTYPRLLSSRNDVTGAIYHSGNGFCYNCHGVDGPARILENTAGPHDVFELSVHNLGVKIPNPVSGSQVKCVNCHANHASDNPRLTWASQEESCYLCHGDSAEQYGIRNAKADITQTSFHNVDGNPTIGNVECVNCHNPHYVRSDLLNTSDPYNTDLIWTDDRSLFCVRCHKNQADNTTTPQKHESLTELVPYTVYFPAFQPTTIVGTAGNLGGWDKSSFITTGIHYNNAPKAVQCTSCHTPHGSPYQRMVSRPEDSLRSDSDGSCSICHSANGAWRSEYGGSSIPDIYAALSQPYAHPILGTDSTFLHDDKEDYANMALDHKHAECQDCHDPHLAKETGTKVGNLSGPLNNVRGVTRSGGVLEATTGAVTEDWQVCYKCHSSFWSNLNAAGMRDIAAEFYRTGTNKSYHFVELTSNANLTTTHFAASRFTTGAVDHDGNPFTATSKLYCQDCHGSPTGAKGPHGSPNQSMLKGSYYTFAETARNIASDLICYRCHKETVYENTSGDYDTGHAVKEGGEHNKPCWVCHGSRVHGSNVRHLVLPYKIDVPEWDPNYEENSWISTVVTNPNAGSKGSCTMRSGAGCNH